MRETPAEFLRRTGHPVPDADVSIAGELLGTVPRPPREDEPCPTLYRDVGPQALAAWLEGGLARLEGPASECIFLRDATLPGYSACVEQFGVLVFLQPLALGPWLSGQDGIWVAENGRLPPAETMGFVPGGTDLKALDPKLLSAATRDELREACGDDYDARVEASRRALAGYLEEWRVVERLSAPIRAALDGPDSQRRGEVQGQLDARGLSEKDLRAPWFHLAPERRAEVLPLLSEVAKRLDGP